MRQHDRGRFARRALAVVGTAALALGGVLSASAAASADDEPPAPSITGTEGTLTIHKHAGTPGTQGDGTEITDPVEQAQLGIGLEGVKFSVERVSYDGAPIDLGTAAGWDQAEGATPSSVASAPYSTVAIAGSPFTTTSAGLIELTDLPYGLYLVTETSPGLNDITEAAQPFLVSIPYPDAETGSWLYNVHVYPKNKLDDDPDKVVSDPTNVTQGSSVTWTITAAVPRPPTDNVYTNFSIIDRLDSRLTLTGTVVKLDGVVLPVTDYILTSPTAGDPPAGNNNTVTVALTPEKLALLQTGQILVVEHTTTVNGAGTIVNTAIRNVNGTTTDIGPAQTNWGLLKVIKQNATTQATLQGAEFELYKSDKTTLVTGPLATNASGEISFPALWVGNGSDLTETYWLKETKAPAGYILPTEDGVWTQVELVADADATVVTKTIPNTQQPGPALPLTGSAGTAAFMIGGAALLVAAGGAALAAARRRQGASK